YLALFGSLLGYPAYFYLLKHLSAATVSLTTLMTPAIALLLGALIVAEPLPASLLWGAGLVVASLSLYQGLWAKLLARFRRA
ncbi:MAG: EamA family transporter, partial [Cellvibrionaceae bacterium]|nr:EamA family transporter [Cellvibrionaceae bacterium]